MSATANIVPTKTNNTGDVDVDVDDIIDRLWVAASNIEDAGRQIPAALYAKPKAAVAEWGSEA